MANIALILNLCADDGEHERIAGVVQMLSSVVGAAEAVLMMADEPLREHAREELPPVDIAYWRRLGDPTFQLDFRMSRGLFEELFVTISPHMAWERETRIEGPIQLMMALWILATPDSFRSVSRKFGVPRCSVHYVYLRVVKAICAVTRQFIQWPSHEEMENIRHRFLLRGPFPGVVGVVDGCNIEIKRPQRNPVAYYDRKGHYSIKIQAICDDTLQFRDVYIGECGSLNDNKVLSRSPVYRAVCNDQAFPDGCHLIGDAAYSIRKTFMRPYKRVNRNDLNDRQRNFNYILSKSRIVIENAFARLQTKWRRILTELDVSRVDYAARHIMACCVLHNFIIRGGESFAERDEAQVARNLRRDNNQANVAASDDEDDEDSDDDREDEEEIAAIDVAQPAARGRRGVVAIRREGQAKQNQIAAMLPVLPREPHVPRRGRGRGRGCNRI